MTHSRTQPPLCGSQTDPRPLARRRSHAGPFALTLSMQDPQGRSVNFSQPTIEVQNIVFAAKSRVNTLILR